MEKEELINAFDTHSKQVYNFIYFRVNQSKEIAEDLAQETFFKAWEYRDKFDPAKASFKTWLFVIARNLVIDYYRKEGSRKIDIDDSDIDQKSSTNVNLDAEIDLEILVNKMKSLKESECELLTLRYIQQMEIEEVAEIIESNYNATKVAIHRALNKLKVLIDGQ